MGFANREDAGRQLAAALERYRGSDALVLGLPRGGVPVAYEVARALGAQLDVWSVRKLGAPQYPELGMGAVAEGGVVFLDPDIVAEVGASRAEVERLVALKSAEVAERAKRFREGRPPPEVAGRTVILVDDGIATGGTARAALDALRAAGAAHLVLAVPVAASDSLKALEAYADEVVCPCASPALYAIGAWYDDFTQVDDGEVVALLRQARAWPAHGARQKSAERAAAVDPREVVIPAGPHALEGTLALPAHPKGLVLFAHGSGSSRFSPGARLLRGAPLRRNWHGR